MTRHTGFITLIVFIGFIAAERSAAAQSRAQATEIAKKAANRARRAISIGPMAGGGIAYASEGGIDGTISLGLGIMLFKDELFDLASAREDMEERIKALLIDKLKQRLQARGLDRDQMSEEELKQVRDELLAELKQEVKAEFKERLNARHSATPKPRVNLHLEGAYLARASAWQVRAGLGIGVSRVSLGPTLIGHFGDTNAFGAGGELAFHYMVGQGTRPLVLQFFLRYDYFVNNRDTLGQQGALGLRALLDII